MDIIFGVDIEHYVYMSCFSHTTVTNMGVIKI
jgi:hypothetical protein